MLSGASWYLFSFPIRRAATWLGMRSPSDLCHRQSRLVCLLLWLARARQTSIAGDGTLFVHHLCGCPADCGINLLRKPEVIFSLAPQPRHTQVIFADVYRRCLYFLYAILLPVWSNAKAPLWSFLINDLILITPFLSHISAVKPEHRNSLVLYTIVLIYSAIISIYYLFFYRPNRTLGSSY